MSLSLLTSYDHKWMTWIALVPLSIALSASAQTPSCPAVGDHAATPAESAYNDGRFADAEGLYQQALTQNPQDADAAAGLVRALLRENKMAQAATQMNTSLAGNPHAASILTEQAELQYRQGEPWLAMQSLDAALAANPCYARAHWIRSRVLRIDSMYASERAEIKKAYDIDPNDPDIQHAWLTVDSPAKDIEATAEALETASNVDDETRKKAEATNHAMMPLLYETSQTCKGVPTEASATIPLQASMADGKHIDGYRLDAEFPQGKGKMIVDTSASGFYISKTLADLNGFKPGDGDPAGTVRATSVRVGPLEFHDCLVGVTDAPFSNKSDGFIGTDLFAPWLITLDPRQSKMILSPLPPQKSVLPGDRTVPPEFADYTPVYHRRQYLLVPLTFGNKARKLFILATGMRYSTMTSEVAHSLSKMTMNFTNTEQTTQGTKVQFFREVFDMQLGDLPQLHQGHILELDPTVMDHNAGFQIAGMLGLDVLQPLILHLDYRDGLVKFQPVSAEFEPGKKTMVASAGSTPESGADAASCQPGDTIDHPLNQTIQASVTGGLDSARLKPGKEIWFKVVNGLAFAGCTIDPDSLIYAHVTSATSTKNSSGAELSLVFDHGDCTGRGKKAVALRLIGIVAPPDQSSHIHDALPSEVAGGGRSISDAMANLPTGEDHDLNPGGPPHTVHPGAVVNMPAVKLEPDGGPACSARITSTRGSVTLGTGSELILTVGDQQATASEKFNLRH